MKPVVIIPAYNPDNALTVLVMSLKLRGFNDIIVVNDGSNEDCASIFADTSEYAVVLKNKMNMGKGAALKHGISRVKELFPDCRYYITADADGQHTVDDICRVSDELICGARFVLTTRDLRGNIPLRSKVGNDLSRVVFTILTGRYLPDNQSGLRGFDISCIEWLTKVSGNKYDYEMNVLLYADRQGIDITELPIETVYIDGNKSSHFNPVRDTIRIYKCLFTTMRASLASIFVFEILAIAVTIAYPFNFWPPMIFVCGFIATVISVITNKCIVFRNFKFTSEWQIIITSAIRYTTYFILCLAGWGLKLPLLACANLAMLLCLPAQFFFHKLMTKRLIAHAKSGACIDSHNTAEIK